MKNKRLYIAAAIIAILLVPYLTKAPWTLSDYVIGGMLLLITGAAVDVVLSKVTNKKKMVVGIIAVLFVAMYVWAELAVGIFTNLGS